MKLFILYSLVFERSIQLHTCSPISMTEHVKSSIESGKFGCGIFIDLKKAFDAVNHTILLKKQEHYGIRGIPYKRFESYLSSRRQFVSVNGHS